jgi:SAM-dependent methyltransferase
MLAIAAGRIRRLPRTRRPGVARGDIRALPFRSAAFGTVIAAYGLLQSVLTDDDLARVIGEAARILEPGGRFGLDLVPDLAKWDEYRRRVRLRGRSAGATITLTETVRQDHRRRLTIFHEEFARTRGRRTERRRFVLTFRTVSVDEMASRLGDAGFVVESISGDYRGRPWTPSAETWLLVARKR